MKKNLIITSLKSEYIKNKANYILGDWCEDINIYKNNLIKNPGQYHWDNFKKRESDLKNLKKINQKLLNYLRLKLNSYLGHNYSERFWKIILLPWIWMFTSYLLDRWTILLNLSKKIPDLEYKKQNFNEKSFITNDHMYFKRSMTQSFWNSYIFHEILKFTKIFTWNKSYKFKKKTL